MDKVSYLGQTLTRWRVGKSTFLAWPEKGARLLNWTVELGDGSIRDVIYWPPNVGLDGFAKVRGGNPILFPFCGRTFDQGEIFFWRDAKGVRRPMPIHGIARQSDFKLLTLDPNGFSARLVPGEDALASYPFEYEFTVTYRFEPLGLVCEFALANLGAEPLPWSAGHHFYFSVPWTEGTGRSDYRVRIAAGAHVRQDAKGSLVAATGIQPEENLANPALSDTQHYRLQQPDVVMAEAGKSGAVVVRVGADRVPHPDATIVTWSESESAPFYCIEPWMGPANAWENKIGLNWVPPATTGKFTVEVAVR
jgi:galactose mutarotase-like enzyme